MPVKKDAAGNRRVEAQVDVPGTPEEVWRAIGTGPGITSWFVPAEVDGREGGKLTLHFAPDGSMDSAATLTAWNPPHRLAATSSDFGEGAPAVATEWTVQALDGSTCRVRVVHSWFADTDDWDDQFEGTEHGWGAFFRILRLYLTHFPGQPSAQVQVMAMAAGSVGEAWQRLAGSLGLTGAARGDRVATAAGAPRLAGAVEAVGPANHPELLIRLEEPAPGAAHLFVVPMQGQTVLPIRIYWYGQGAAAAAAEQGPIWQKWMAQTFPNPG